MDTDPFWNKANFKVVSLDQIFALSFLFFFCMVSKYFPILLIIIIAIRNVCRIIIWKDLNWKMCNKDPYYCGKGSVYTVFDLNITVFLLTVMYKVILQLLWNICINELIYTTKNDIYICISCLRNTASHIYSNYQQYHSPGVIIISPFFKAIYNKVAVHLLKQFSIWKMVLI